MCCLDSRKEQKSSSRSNTLQSPTELLIRYDLIQGAVSRQVSDQRLVLLSCGREELSLDEMLTVGHDILCSRCVFDQLLPCS